MAHNLGSLFAQNFATGIGSGLQSLAQNKMKEIEHNKISKLFEQSGYDQPTSQLLSNIYQADPKNFYHTLGLLNGNPQGQQNTQPVQQNMQQGQLGPQEQLAIEPQKIGLQQALAKPKSEAHLLQIEKRKDKFKPDLEYIEDLLSTVRTMKGLLPNISKGALTSLASQVPLIGNHLLDTATGSFNNLGKKFVIDAAQKSKGLRSVKQLQVIEASKPGLDKTEKQNEFLLNYWEKELERKKKKFFKDHPEFADEVFDMQTTEESSPSKKQQIEEDDKGNIYIDGVLTFKKKVK